MARKATSQAAQRLRRIALMLTELGRRQREGTVACSDGTILTGKTMSDDECIHRLHTQQRARFEREHAEGRAFNATAHKRRRRGPMCEVAPYTYVLAKKGE